MDWTQHAGREENVRSDGGCSRASQSGSETWNSDRKEMAPWWPLQLWCSVVTLRITGQARTSEVVESRWTLAPAPFLPPPSSELCLLARSFSGWAGDLMPLDAVLLRRVFPVSVFDLEYSVTVMKTHEADTASLTFAFVGYPGRGRWEKGSRLFNRGGMGSLVTLTGTQCCPDGPGKPDLGVPIRMASANRLICDRGRK